MSIIDVALKQKEYALRNPYNRAHNHAGIAKYRVKLTGTLYGELFATLIVDEVHDPKTPHWQLSLTKADVGPSMSEQNTCREVYRVPLSAQRTQTQMPGRNGPQFTVVVYNWPLDSVEAHTYQLNTHREQLHA